MNEFTNEVRSLAAFTVIGELYDNGSDIYEIISEFIKEIIISENMFKFNLIDIKESLKKTYSFKIPTEIIKASLKRLKITRYHGNYTVKDWSHLKSNSIKDSQNELVVENKIIIQNLVDFVESNSENTLVKKEKEMLVQSFCSFLLDESSGQAFSDLISAYIIKNKGDTKFTNTLNSIKEGVVLYTGINYDSDFNKSGWKSYMNIYLDTQMLFHFIGYNGIAFKESFQEFYDLIKEVNKKAQKRLIKLKYFREVKEEVNRYFDKAEEIVMKKEMLDPKISAMDEIVKGCKKASEVILKRTEFFQFFEEKNIHECQITDYYEENNYKYNIEDAATLEYFSETYDPQKIKMSVKFLNYINILRKGAECRSINETNYILLTDKNDTINMANHSLIKKDKEVPLAMKQSSFTKKLWIRLNKGFGGTMPRSFDVITKAQKILAKHINDSVAEKFETVKSRYNSGDLTQDNVLAAIVELRSRVKKPEDINENDTAEILEDINEEGIERIVNEQSFLTNRAKIKEQENNSLVKEVKEKDRIIEYYKKNEKLNELKNLENKLIQKQKKLNKKVNKFYIFECCIVMLILFAFLITPIIAIKIYGWNKVEPITYLISQLITILPIFSLLFFRKNFKVLQFLHNRKNFYRTKIYKKHKFNVHEVKAIQMEVNEITEVLKTIKPSS